ncbi:Fic family protein [Erwinia sp. S63]|uniref:Fic family protein n=1 Tax=Erwinia sp. S63 TaxID=2769341 RepID=UPI001909DE53|nr:Fic family protein [Erwinia sp. S63]
MIQPTSPVDLSDLQHRILSTIAGAESSLSSGDLAGRLGVGRSTIKRHVEVLLGQRKITRHGVGRGTRYTALAPLNKLPQSGSSVTEKTPEYHSSSHTSAQSLLQYLNLPLSVRDISGYDRSFVDNYIPNETFLLPQTLALALMNEGKMAGQQPAGTYARKVLEQLLIDLSWSSSQLEGNRYSLLATEELFKSGAASNDLDAVMLLNHKQAIEFLVDAVPESGLTGPVISNLHALLMHDLLSNPDELGAIRRKIVNISGTTYTPLQAPFLLQEMFDIIIKKSRLINNPVESAFFLWVNIAYLQPFEDGNKRTSRLAANIPLMIYNSAPLSFLDADVTSYAYAMMGIYEKRDVTLAVELFEHLYRRSIKRYAVTLEAMGVPDPFRLRHREDLNTTIRLIVAEGQNIESAMQMIDLDPDDRERFMQLLQNELRILSTLNCARYRLSISLTEQWIRQGRPA